MKSFLLRLLGVGFLIMSETSVAATGSNLLLETSQGQIEIKLLPDIAPNHVARISELAASGFYDGIIFHRVIPGFMAQTGDPTGTGMGGSGSKLTAEFSDYEYRNGTVGMARSMSPDSGDSQFFICFQPRFSLDDKYTVFGRVTSGMQFVDAIERGEPPASPSKVLQASIAADNVPPPAFSAQPVAVGQPSGS